jgi:hypothetical protein
MSEPKIIPSSEADYVLFGNKYLTVVDFIEELEDFEDKPEFVFVADRYPLRIRAKSKVEDFTCDWDKHFQEWTYPPEWSGAEEFQRAIDAFSEAANRFEAANTQWFGLCCDHTKKIRVSELT